ncbi:MAG: hypothetical protein HYY96_04355 [Candidatus Tectomicrobia bacterium]|nr:hypothetical protein [Candidatus Tectomicrobia bacterium]
MQHQPVYVQALQPCPRSAHADAILAQRDGPATWRFCLRHDEGPLLHQFQHQGTICSHSPYAVSLLLLFLARIRLASAVIAPCEHAGYLGILNLEHDGNQAELRCAPAAAILMATVCKAPLLIARSRRACTDCPPVPFSRPEGATLREPWREEELRSWLAGLTPEDFR